MHVRRLPNRSMLLEESDRQPASFTQQIPTFHKSDDMNWTGGTLSRLSKGAGKDKLQKQKAYFAKHRNRTKDSMPTINKTISKTELRRSVSNERREILTDHFVESGSERSHLETVPIWPTASLLQAESDMSHDRNSVRNAHQKDESSFEIHRHRLLIDQDWLGVVSARPLRRKLKKIHGQQRIGLRGARSKPVQKSQLQVHQVDHHHVSPGKEWRRNDGPQEHELSSPHRLYGAITNDINARIAVTDNLDVQEQFRRFPSADDSMVCDVGLDVIHAQAWSKAGGSLSSSGELESLQSIDRRGDNTTWLTSRRDRTLFARHTRHKTPPLAGSKHGAETSASKTSSVQVMAKENSRSNLDSASIFILEQRAGRDACAEVNPCAPVLDQPAHRENITFCVGTSLEGDRTFANNIRDDSELASTSWKRLLGLEAESATHTQELGRCGDSAPQSSSDHGVMPSMHGIKTTELAQSNWSNVNVGSGTPNFTYQSSSGETALADDKDILVKDHTKDRPDELWKDFIFSQSIPMSQFGG